MLIQYLFWWCKIVTADFNNSVPIYQQILDRLLLAVATGELPIGGKVPPVRELAVSFKVNPNTVQRALASLEEMGYVHSESTSGRYVTKNEEKILSLQKMLPIKITKEYIQQMESYGIQDIPAFVAQFLEGGNT
jgi:DNA-binding transcriptional regulator YhcF (GntR family)